MEEQRSLILNTQGIKWCITQSKGSFEGVFKMNALLFKHFYLQYGNEIL